MRRFNGYMHGIDIGGWLSQCDYSKEHLDNFITEEDIKRIKGWGCDHVRVPVDYNIFQDENGFIESGFNYVQKCIDWCGNNGINMILDLHKTMGFSLTRLRLKVGSLITLIFSRNSMTFGKSLQSVSANILTGSLLNFSMR